MHLASTLIGSIKALDLCLFFFFVAGKLLSPIANKFELPNQTNSVAFSP